MIEATYLIRLRDMFTSPLKKMESQMNRFENSLMGTQGSVNNLGASLTSAFAGGALIAGAAMLADKVKDIGLSAVSASMDFNNLKSAISFASGENAAANLSFLDKLVDRLGLVKQAAYSGFKTFEGGIMGTSLEGKKGLEIFEALSEAGTVMKLNADQMGGAFLAIGQMASKGTVSAEELRGQLGERLPGAFNIAARAMNMTTGQLGEMLKKGEIVSDVFLPKFAAELKKTFGPGVSKAQTEFGSNWNRFTNYIDNAKIALGDRLIPVIDNFIKLIPKMDFTPLLTPMRALWDQVSALGDQFSILWQSLGGSTGMQLFKEIATGFAIMAGSIGLVVQGVNQLMALLRNSTAILGGFAETLHGMYNMDPVKMLNGVQVMTDNFERLTSEATGMWKAFEEGQDKIFNSINNMGLSNAAFGNAPGGPSRANFFSHGVAPVKGTGNNNKGSGVEKIASGTRNITLNIAKLIENVNFHQSLSEDPAKLKQLMTRTILAAVNDANIAAQ